MKSKVEKIENSKDIKLEITIEAEKFDAAINNVFKKSAGYFNIPGFRKGKAPMNMVEKVYGTEIFYEDAFNEVVPEAYEKALEENNIDAVSKPNIDVIQIGKGKDLIFTAVVSVKPEVKLGKYKAMSLEKNVYKVTDETINHELAHMQETNSRLVSVTDRTVQSKDIAVIDFEGFVDGVAFEGGKAENHELEIGSNTFIPGFEDQVIGMKIDETKDINVKFPEEYFSKELAGKDAVFKVTVHEIKEKELPTLDDEFAKDVSEFESLEELKADLKAKKEEQNANRSKVELEEKAIEAICEASSVEIPEGMVEIELDHMVEDMDARLQYQGMKFEQYLTMIGKTMADFRNESKETAEKSIKTRLVLEAVGKDANIEATDEEVKEKIAELAKIYARDEEELNKNEHLKGHLKENIVAEKTIKYIVDSAKVKEVEKVEECGCGHDHAPKKSTTKKTTKKKDEE